MMELWMSIAVNVVLGIVLLALLYRKGRGENVRLSRADEAMNVFLMHFPDARCRNGSGRPAGRADRSATRRGSRDSRTSRPSLECSRSGAGRRLLGPTG